MQHCQSYPSPHLYRRPGVHYWEPATPIISEYNAICTDQSIYLYRPAIYLRDHKAGQQEHRIQRAKVLKPEESSLSWLKPCQLFFLSRYIISNDGGRSSSIKYILPEVLHLLFFTVSNCYKIYTIFVTEGRFGQFISACKKESSYVPETGMRTYDIVKS